MVLFKWNKLQKRSTSCYAYFDTNFMDFGSWVAKLDMVNPKQTTWSNKRAKVTEKVRFFPINLKDNDSLQWNKQKKRYTSYYAYFDTNFMGFDPRVAKLATVGVKQVKKPNHEKKWSFLQLTQRILVLVGWNKSRKRCTSYYTYFDTNSMNFGWRVAKLAVVKSQKLLS